MNTDFIRPAIAIVLTACGIETGEISCDPLLLARIAIVLTACGIETHCDGVKLIKTLCKIAIVLTACGIETNQQQKTMGDTNNNQLQ